MVSSGTRLLVSLMRQAHALRKGHHDDAPISDDVCGCGRNPGERADSFPRSDSGREGERADGGASGWRPTPPRIRSSRSPRMRAFRARVWDSPPADGDHEAVRRGLSRRTHRLGRTACVRPRLAQTARTSTSSAESPRCRAATSVSVSRGRSTGSTGRTKRPSVIWRRSSARLLPSSIRLSSMTSSAPAISARNRDSLKGGSLLGRVSPGAVYHAFGSVGFRGARRKR